MPAFFSSPRGDLIPAVSAALALVLPAVHPSHHIPTYSPQSGLTASGWGPAPLLPGLPPEPPASTSAVATDAAHALCDALSIWPKTAAAVARHGYAPRGSPAPLALPSLTQLLALPVSRLMAASAFHNTTLAATAWLVKLASNEDNLIADAPDLLLPLRSLASIDDTAALMITSGALQVAYTSDAQRACLLPIAHAVFAYLWSIHAHVDVLPVPPDALPPGSHALPVFVFRANAHPYRIHPDVDAPTSRLRRACDFCSHPLRGSRAVCTSCLDAGAIALQPDISICAGCRAVVPNPSICPNFNWGCDSPPEDRVPINPHDPIARQSAIDAALAPWALQLAARAAASHSTKTPYLDTPDRRRRLTAAIHSLQPDLVPTGTPRTVIVSRALDAVIIDIEARARLASKHGGEREYAVAELATAHAHHDAALLHAHAARASVPQAVASANSADLAVASATTNAASTAAAAHSAATFASDAHTHHATLATTAINQRSETDNLVPHPGKPNSLPPGPPDKHSEPISLLPGPPDKPRVLDSLVPGPPD